MFDEIAEGAAHPGELGLGAWSGDDCDDIAVVDTPSGGADGAMALGMTSDNNPRDSGGDQFAAARGKPADGDAGPVR